MLLAERERLSFLVIDLSIVFSLDEETFCPPVRIGESHKRISKIHYDNRIESTCNENYDEKMLLEAEFLLETRHIFLSGSKVTVFTLIFIQL